jgi:hypothetical protein
MQFRISGLIAIAALAVFCPLASSQSLAQNALFYDNFNSFVLGTNWEVPNYLNPSNDCNCSGATFLGAPNVNLGIGYNGLRMTSAQTNAQLRAIATTQTFNLNNGSVEVNFFTGKYSDAGLSLPPGTNDFNIDGVIDVECGTAVFVNMFAGNFGNNRVFCENISASNGLCSSDPNDWQYSQYYKIILTSRGTNASVLLENSAGQTLFSFPVPVLFHDLGNFNVILSQSMGTPGASYYNDVFIQHVKVSRQ